MSCPSLGGKERRVVKSACDDLLNIKFKKSIKSTLKSVTLLVVNLNMTRSKGIYNHYLSHSV